MSTKTTEKRGFFESAFQGAFWNSRIKSANVTKKEMWLGYVIGPYGMLLAQSIVNSYHNRYLTDVLGFTVDKGLWIASFMILFPVISKIIDAITNVIMCRIIDSTTCRQGKVRPWFIVSAPFAALSIILLFWIPKFSVQMQAVWVVIAYNLYYSVSYTMWNMAKELSPALSTRNVNQRKSLSMASSIVKNVGTGMISILFPTILSAVVSALHGDEAQGYFVTMGVIACLAIPLTFIQYFYTKERVTEERRYGATASAEAGVKGTVKEKSLWEQARVCLKDKYWIWFALAILASGVISNLRNISLVYYCGWVVRGNAYGSYAAIQRTFQIIAMQPMFWGILILLPLQKRFSRRAIIGVGGALTAAGSAIAYFGAGHTMPIYIGSAIAAFGITTFNYVLMTYMGDVIDHIEWKTGVRTDGLTGGMAGSFYMFAVGIAQGLFNLGLMVTRYAQPEAIGVSEAGVTLYADQTVGAVNWINFAYQGSYILLGSIMFLIFMFIFDIEKKLPQVTKELEERTVKQYAAMGIEYIPAAEQQRREIEAQEKEAEENRIRELKELCAKKHLDFDTENEKYLAKKAKKLAKQKK